MRAILIILGILALIVISVATPAAALAEPWGADTVPSFGWRDWYYDQDGWLCDMDVQDTLAKIVCRNPRNQRDFYVCYLQRRFDLGIVFFDCFNGRTYAIRSEQAPLHVWPR